MSKITTDLAALIHGEVTDDQTSLGRAANDASLFEVMPEAVVFPKDVSDIKALVRYVAEHKAENPTLSLTARAAGTDMSGGPLNDSIILDLTKHVNHIGTITESEGTAQPGVFYRDFEIETLKEGVLMPSYPASRIMRHKGKGFG